MERRVTDNISGVKCLDMERPVTGREPRLADELHDAP